MGLNIKNERVHELARQAAAVTGKSQTGAIEAVSYTHLDVYKRQRVDEQRRPLAECLDLRAERVVLGVMQQGEACLLYTSRCV